MTLKITILMRRSILIDELPLVGLVGDEFFSLGTLFDRFIFQSMPMNFASWGNTNPYLSYASKPEDPNELR